MMSEQFVQKDQGFFVYPAGGWRKAMFKWPVQLWRLGLGPLLGRQMMLITHTGRKSGLPRRAMTERHVYNGRAYAPSGFGGRSQWVKNLQVDPRATIQAAHGPESVLAVRVEDDEELLGILEVLGKRYGPLYNAFLASFDIEPNREDILAKKDRLYFIRFDPTDQSTPPPLPADLVWIWPFAFVGLIAGWLALRRGR